MVYEDLVIRNNTKLVLLVADGLGGLPHPEFEGKTELEYAHTPNLDRLAARSALGLHLPLSPGLSPGSGPAHLSLFGYDPFEHRLGRGVLEALGLDAPLEPGDVALRGNFVRLDADGKVADRRAGRISDEEARPLLLRLKNELSTVDDVELIWIPGKEHRFALILRGPDVSEDITDTDPQQEGVPPQEARPTSPRGEKTARVLQTVMDRAREILAGEKANGVVFRGAATLPSIPSFEERWGLKAMGLAYYPMYRGLAKLVGMTVPHIENFDEALEKLQHAWESFDFFFIHFKEPDKKGEDGDFAGKVKAIETLDAHLPRILELHPTVLVVTGDHATPALYHAHSWHPVPVLLHGPFSGQDGVEAFHEKVCRQGSLGMVGAPAILPLMLANAGRLKRYGA